MDTLIRVNRVSQIYQVKNKLKNGNMLKRLFKSDKKIITALNNLSFEINKGEIVGYIGQNGAGKSTSIKLMLGLLYPTKGEIELMGKNPFKYRNQLSQEIGVLMGQKTHLWWDLPLIDSFYFLKGIYQIGDHDFKKQLDYLTETLRIEKFINQPVRQLSLGQRMRGETVATFLHKPSIVFLDEPTIGLDIRTKQQVLELLLNLNKNFGTTIILTTHELSDIEKICNRMILLEQGCKIYDGDLAAYMNDNKNLIRAIIKSDKNLDLPKELFYLNSVNLNSFEYIIDMNRLNETEIFGYLKNVDLVDVQFLPIELPDLIKMNEDRIK
ncbi:ATP-binding cassette domain-containing protein [Virgibacillus pantothenticus]|uniref:ABC transporter ATP-binding protein n=1 Tax=Virgibacillus pantothenticus TaxID=1473 RepID=UPI003D29DD2F